MPAFTPVGASRLDPYIVGVGLTCVHTDLWLQSPKRSPYTPYSIYLGGEYFLRGSNLALI